MKKLQRSPNRCSNFLTSPNHCSNFLTATPSGGSHVSVLLPMSFQFVDRVVPPDSCKHVRMSVARCCTRLASSCDSVHKP